MSKYYTRNNKVYVKIKDIHVGNRLRKDLGDIESLAKSIKQIGLLHPPAVRPDGTLIAGYRRLRALKINGEEETPVNIVKGLTDVDRILRAEQEENTCRKPLLPSEMVNLIDCIYEVEKKEAKERQRKHAGTAPGKKKFTSAKFAEVNGEAKKRAAKVGGVSAPTYTKAKHVVEKSKEDPVKFGPLVEEMDRTKKIDPVYKKTLRVEKGLTEEPNEQEQLQEAFDESLRLLNKIKKQCGGSWSDFHRITIKKWKFEYAFTTNHVVPFVEEVIKLIRGWKLHDRHVRTTLENLFLAPK